MSMVSDTIRSVASGKASSLDGAGATGAGGMLLLSPPLSVSGGSLSSSSMDLSMSSRDLSSSNALLLGRLGGITDDSPLEVGPGDVLHGRTGASDVCGALVELLREQAGDCTPSVAVATLKAMVRLVPALDVATPGGSPTSMASPGRAAAAAERADRHRERLIEAGACDVLTCLLAQHPRAPSIMHAGLLLVHGLAHRSAQGAMELGPAAAVLVAGALGAFADPAITAAACDTVVSLAAIEGNREAMTQAGACEAAGAALRAVVNGGAGDRQAGCIKLCRAVIALAGIEGEAEVDFKCACDGLVAALGAWPKEGEVVGHVCRAMAAVASGHEENRSVLMKAGAWEAVHAVKPGFRGDQEVRRCCRLAVEALEGK